MAKKRTKKGKLPSEVLPLVGTLKGHSGFLNALAVSNDGKVAVSASDDGTGRIWDLTSFSELHVLRAGGDPVRSASICIDGRRALTVDTERAHLWVDSARLCNDLGDATWEAIRQQHFAKAVSLIHQCKGIVVKNTGDGVIALFHDATAAVLFGVGLHTNSGHAVVRVRIGVHVGQIAVNNHDTFGRHVNLASRIMGALKSDGVIASDRVKQDINQRREAAAQSFEWRPLDGVVVKGFDDPMMLWAVQVNQ